MGGRVDGLPLAPATWSRSSDVVHWRRLGTPGFGFARIPYVPAGRQPAQHQLLFRPRLKWGFDDRKAGCPPGKEP